MSLDEVLSSIDAEIDLLKQARALLSGDGITARAAKSKAAPTSSKKHHRMSTAGRKRIAEAQRKRWAALKKSTKAI